MARPLITEPEGLFESTLKLMKLMIGPSITSLTLATACVGSTEGQVSRSIDKEREECVADCDDLCEGLASCFYSCVYYCDHPVTHDWDDDDDSAVDPPPTPPEPAMQITIREDRNPPPNGMVFNICPAAGEAIELTAGLIDAPGCNGEEFFWEATRPDGRAIEIIHREKRSIFKTVSIYFGDKTSCSSNVDIPVDIPGDYTISVTHTVLPEENAKLVYSMPATTNSLRPYLGVDPKDGLTKEMFPFEICGLETFQPDYYVDTYSSHTTAPIRVDELDLLGINHTCIDIPILGRFCFFFPSFAEESDGVFRWGCPDWGDAFGFYDQPVGGGEDNTRSLKSIMPCFASGYDYICPKTRVEVKFESPPSDARINELIGIYNLQATSPIDNNIRHFNVEPGVYFPWETALMMNAETDVVYAIPDGTQNSFTRQNNCRTYPVTILRQ